ncbi:hypothetical protein WAC87_004161 [Shigella flexneri]
MVNKYSDAFPGARFDRRVPGFKDSNLRPDAYFPDLEGQSVIFDIGGKSKMADILKYTGMADIILPVLH